MAGSAKPNIIGLKKEAIFTRLNGSGVNGQNGSGLFDGTNVDGWNANNLFYWNIASNYVEVDIQSTIVNIWRSGVASYPGYIGKLKINKWNGTSYDDVTNSYTQVVTAIGHTLWEKTISDLPRGRYKFDFGTGLRIDSEWYIEDMTLPNRTLISTSDGFKKWNLRTPPTPSISGDITSGKVYNSSSNYAGSTTPEKAFDDNGGFNGSYTTNGWMSNLSTGWVSVDLGTSKRICKATLVQYGYNGLYYRCGNFKIEYSDDNIAWKTAYTGVLANNYTTQEFYFDSIGRYWRVNISDSSAGGAVGIAEMELMEVLTESPEIPAHWETVTSILPNLTQFKEKGMEDLSFLERKLTTSIETLSQSEVIGEGKIFKANIEIKKYIDLKKISIK